MDFTFLQHDGFPGLDQPVFYEAATDFTASAGAYPLIACTEQFSMQIFLKTQEMEWNLPGSTVWTFNPFYHKEIQPEQIRWFAAVDEVKPVKNKTHLLITASGGCVCLIRISDQKIVFCGYAGGNTHSAEILPDGNIVTASSTGNYLRLFRLRYDSPDQAVQISTQDYYAENAHGVVWDRKRNCLWSSGQLGIYRWYYHAGSDPSESFLEADCCVNTGRDGADFCGHDLYPVFGEDALYLSGNQLLKFYPASMTYEEVLPGFTAVKSISRQENGADLITVSTESWWTDTVCLRGKTALVPFRRMDNMRFYKVRWLTANPFSYDE